VYAIVFKATWKKGGLMMKDNIDTFVCALKAGGRSSRTIETYQWRLTKLREATEKPTLATCVYDLLG
jgi:hypothetical protein